jgi:uncharacterized membrane protein
MPRKRNTRRMIESRVREALHRLRHETLASLTEDDLVKMLADEVEVIVRQALKDVLVGRVSGLGDRWRRWTGRRSLA